MKGQITFILKPVSTVCNLACQYCYNHYLRSCDLRTLDDKLMPISILRLFFQQIRELENETISFIWHGGEPLLAGIEFFNEAADIQTDYLKDRVVYNSVQTNGTLINRRWAEFFEKRSFKIGISLDGPEELHNKFRKFPNGSGSFSLIMRNREILRERKLDAGVISVVTKNSLNFAREILDFFTKMNLNRINFSACSERENGKLTDYSISPLEWADFLIEIFEYWMEKDNPDIKIQLLENFFQGLIGGYPTLCYHNRECNRYLAVDSNGDIFLCGRFMGIEYFKLGNILERSLKSILSSKKYKEISLQTRQTKKECLKCRWAKICNGGCSYYRFMNGGTISSPYFFCLSTKKLLKHMYSAIEGLNPSVLKSKKRA